ncbi:transposase [Ferruginibacter sp. SUN106]|uniref:transposase n=1 Tax=Ferruginibacter sp. SUN106 TaxID=2978348 RepID=UPI003D36ECE6
MPVSELLKSPFVAGNHYHLVFKSIDGVLLFREENDYAIFLERFQQFTAIAFTNWAYCQLSNHVHFIIKVKPLENIIKAISKTDQTKQTVAMKKLLTLQDNLEALDAMIERQVNSFMVSYANYTKNKYLHDGGLFQKPFKRIAIDTDTHLQMAIIYVHANIIKHKVFDNHKEYLHSSYNAISINNNFYCASAAVLQFFGGVEKFIRSHEEQINYYYQKGFPNSKLE